MKLRQLDFLICLECGQPLNCKIFTLEKNNYSIDIKNLSCTSRCVFKDTQFENKFLSEGINREDFCKSCYTIEIMEGLLNCNCGAQYPIINGIPRILPDNFNASLLSKHQPFFKIYAIKFKNKFNNLPCDDLDIIKQQKETQQHFSYEWERFSNYSADNLSKYIDSKQGGILKQKIILDAGCGVGRHMSLFSQIATSIFGMDISEAIEIAFMKNRNLPNVNVLQADIYHLPFRDGSFDVIYSFGVLQHLPFSKLGFLRLIDLLKKGGFILIWVYSSSLKKQILKIIKWLTLKIPRFLHQIVAYQCGVFDYFILINFYKIACKLPLIDRIVNKVMPLRIKEYANYNFYVSVTDWYDRLFSPISWYFRIEDIISWFCDASLVDIKIYRIGNFWLRGFGKKE